MLEPVDARLPDGAAATSIAVKYPERRLNLFGWRMHWLAVLTAVSTCFAFALRRYVGVSL